MASTRRPSRLLLVEPQQLLRRTVISVAAELRLALIEESTGIESAETMLGLAVFDGLVVTIDDDGHATAMLERVRAGAFATPADVPVIVMADRCTERTIAGMRALGVRRILLKPFKVKDVLGSVASLCGVAA